MKKLFTLVALLAVFMGAKAVNWDEVKKIDYKGLTDFPYYIMGYAPDIVNGIMVDDPVPYRKLWRGNENDFPGEDACEGQVTINGGSFYLQKLESNPWRQYFVADGVATDIGDNYKIVARVKSSQDCTVHVNMGDWSKALGADVLFPASDDFQDVEWTYDEIPVSSCFIIAQPGVTDAVIEWESITVYKQRKEGGRPQVWLQDIDNGNAEKSWVDMQLDGITYNDMERNFKICAWSKEKGRNVDETADGQPWNPFPADIEVDPKDPNNHVFVCHGQPATTSGDASAWDNQFWIQSKHAWTSGTKLKIKFRYMCDYATPVKTNTQVHHQTPSDYLIWHAIGDITFTDEWKTFDDVMNIGDDMAEGWSIAFNLNADVKDAVNFYFDDLSWEYLELDEGYFVSGVNVGVNPKYEDLDNAVPFEAVDDFNYVGTFGTKGDANTYVDQVMISTKRGDDPAFKGATLKPQDKVRKSDPDQWIDYEPSSNAKIDLPGLGVWKVYLDTEYKAMAFEMLEGTPYVEPDPVPVFTYADELVLHAVERDFLTADADGNSREPGGEIGNGQPWDSQFWIAADRDLKTDEVTVLKFQYKGSIAAHTSTQVHKVGDDGKPCTYLNWQAIGDVDFTEEWQDFETEFKVPSGDNGMRSIVFNMAEIKAACDYSIKNVQWYIKDASLEEGQTYENLISGASNFYMKEEATTAPYTGINNVIINTGKTSSAIYNLAGQKVNNNFKGIVVKEGKKFVNK